MPMNKLRNTFKSGLINNGYRGNASKATGLSNMSVKTFRFLSKGLHELHIFADILLSPVAFD